MTSIELAALLPLTAAAVCDLRRRVIPNWTVGLLAVCAVWRVAAGLIAWHTALISALLLGGGLLAAAVRWDGIGGGDVKLCAALAALCGLTRALELLTLALLGLLLYAALRRARRLPLAPFLWGAFFVELLIM